MIVLDTNVLSELMRATPDDRVMDWLRSQPPSGLFTTAVTAAELLYGCARLPGGRRREHMSRQVRTMLDTDFRHRVLPFDVACAEQFAVLVAERQRTGSPVGYPDAQIAAICLSVGAALATRNGRDFAGVGLTVVDPWDAS